VTYSGYTDDLSADLGAFGGRLEPSNYRERSLGSVGVAPRAAHRRPNVASAFAPGDRAYRPRFPLVLDAHLRVVTANRGFLSDVQDELIRTFRLVRFWTGRANVSGNRTLDAPSLRSSIVNVGPGPHV